MTVFIGTYTPYEMDKYKVLKYLEDRTQGIKRSLRLIEKDTEHLVVRCPVSGDYVDVLGTDEEVRWLHQQLTIRNWYRP